ncbi:MAG: PIN domain-containing protein [Pirellulales bacterium]|nr:PIN domain-containing protein [Pirellulales bacterium]
MKIVGIDSNVLIYAGVVPRTDKATSPGQQELTIRAQLLLHSFGAEDQIILPTVAVSEILVPVAPMNQGALVAQLRARFVCPPFDLQASSIAADLWAQFRKLPKNETYPDRHVLRADAMIVAAAKALGATVFYSHNKDCRQLAALVMDAQDLPERDPNDMFAVEEIRSGRLKVEDLMAPRTPVRRQRRRP